MERNSIKVLNQLASKLSLCQCMSVYTILIYLIIWKIPTTVRRATRDDKKAEEKYQIYLSTLKDFKCLQTSCIRYFLTWETLLVFMLRWFKCFLFLPPQMICSKISSTWSFDKLLSTNITVSIFSRDSPETSKFLQINQGERPELRLYLDLYSSQSSYCLRIDPSTSKICLYPLKKPEEYDYQKTECIHKNDVLLEIWRRGPVVVVLSLQDWRLSACTGRWQTSGCQIWVFLQ